MLRHYQVIENRIQDCAPDNANILIYVNPTDEEKKYLISEIRIDEHTLQSTLDPDELSRLEFETDHVAVIFKRPKSYSAEDRFLFRTTSMGIFLFREKMIIVASEESPMFDDKRFTRISSLKELLLKMLYRSIFHFLEHLKIINMITDDLEEKISMAMENKYLLNLFTLEKSLVYYLNAINSNSILLQRLKNNVNKISFTQDEEELLDDIIIENNQCFKQADIYANILSSLMDARASIISNNLNILMKTLNIITICIMVPTFVVSAFSMNVAIPLQHHPMAFWIVMLLGLVSLLIFYLFWKYNKW